MTLCKHAPPHLDGPHRYFRNSFTLSKTASDTGQLTFTVLFDDGAVRVGVVGMFLVPMLLVPVMVPVVVPVVTV